METRAHRVRRQDHYYDTVEVDKLVDGQTVKVAVEVPQPYKHVEMTKLRLAILKALNDWHQIDILLLHRLVEKDIGPVYYNWLQKALKTLRKEAGYIWCPEEQFLTWNSDYKRLVYQLTERGQNVLRDNGVRVTTMGEYGLRWSKFAHDWMTTHHVASLYLSAEGEYVPPATVATRAPVKASPFRFKYEETDILPDFPLFGYIFKKHDLFLIWETNCNNESIETVLLPKLIGYHKLLQTDYFEKRLDITTPPYVCLITTNDTPGRDTHMRNIIGQVKKQIGKSEHLLFRTVDHFSTLEHTPDPVTDIWNIEWARVGYDPVKLSQLEE